MPSILTCPQCHSEVPLPEGRVERFECPHCQHELRLAAFSLQQVEESVPPQQVLMPAPLPAPTPRPAETARPGTAVADYRKRVAQQAQRPSALGQMVGILAGGLLGMVMGYWLLNYFGGPRYNFLNVALPWVAHTQKAKPAVEPRTSGALATGPFMEEEEPPPRRVAPLPPAPVVSNQVEPPTTAPAAVTFPTYTSDDLGQALSEAHAAAGCEKCRSTGYITTTVVTGTTETNGKKIESKAKKQVPCDACGGKPTGRIDAYVYAKFCRLAEVITFIDDPRGDPNFHHRKEAVEDVFRRAAADNEKQAALGRLAMSHLEKRDRSQQGVLLAGTVQETGQSGDYHWVRMLLFGRPAEVLVVYPLPTNFKPRDRLLLAGSIVDDPLGHLPGYAGPATQVVFGGLPVRLHEPR
jgi:hypothetical protein